MPIADEYPEKYDRLLCGGIWCIVQLDYEVEGDNNFGLIRRPHSVKTEKAERITPISIRKLTPIQMPHMDIDALKAGTKAFTKEEWLDILLRSIGMEPDELTPREVAASDPNDSAGGEQLQPLRVRTAQLLVSRICTRKSRPTVFLFPVARRQLQTFSTTWDGKQWGLVGLWDCVAFDEVAGIKFKDKDGIQIMKDYMASGSFARGKEEKAASPRWSLSGISIRVWMCS